MKEFNFLRVWMLILNNIHGSMLLLCTVMLVLRTVHLSPAEWRSQGLSCSSQLAQFQEFLLRVNKYKCLKMKGERGAAEIKLILVEVCTVSSTCFRLSVSTFF